MRHYSLYKFESKRLKYTPISESNFDELHKMFLDKETMKHIPVEINRDETKKKLNQMLDNWKSFGYGIFAVVLKEEASFIGYCGFTKEKDAISFGYVFCSKYFGNGYGSEAVKAVLDYSFKTFKLSNVVAYVSPENTASKKILSKNNFSFVNIFKFNNHSMELWKFSEERQR